MNIVEARCVCFDDMINSSSSSSTIYPEEEAELMSSELRVADEVITKMELDLARAAEKLVNLSIRMMHASIKENELEAVALTTTTSSSSSCDSLSLGCDSVETLEFDLLCRIVESQVTEVELFIKTVQQNMIGFEAHKHNKQYYNHNHNHNHNHNLGKILIAMEERLHDAEESLNQSQDQILEIRDQSTKFKRTLYHLNLGRLNWNDNNNDESKFIEGDHIGQFSDNKAKIKMQTAKHQRRILRMLEKSLAREMDLEKKLTEAKQIEKDLKHTLISTQQDLSFTQEQVSQACERWFEAENATEIFKGISKELLHQYQFMNVSSIHDHVETTTSFERRSHELNIDTETSEEEEDDDDDDEEEMISLELNSDDTHFSDVVSDKLSSSEEDDIEDEDKLILPNNYHTINFDGWIWGCDFKFGNLK